MEQEDINSFKKMKKKKNTYSIYNYEIGYFLKNNESRISIYEWLREQKGINSSYQNFCQYVSRNKELLISPVSNLSNNIKKEVNNEKITNTATIIEEQKSDFFYESAMEEMKRKIQAMNENKE